MSAIPDPKLERNKSNGARRWTTFAELITIWLRVPYSLPEADNCAKQKPPFTSQSNSHLACLKESYKTKSAFSIRRTFTSNSNFSSITKLNHPASHNVWYADVLTRYIIKVSVYLKVIPNSLSTVRLDSAKSRHNLQHNESFE